MYKMELVLNNLYSLICHKTESNKTEKYFYVRIGKMHFF